MPADMCVDPAEPAEILTQTHTLLIEHEISMMQHAHEQRVNSHLHCDTGACDVLNRPASSSFFFFLAELTPEQQSVVNKRSQALKPTRPPPRPLSWCRTGQADWCCRPANLLGRWETAPPLWALHAATAGIYLGALPFKCTAASRASSGLF